MKKGQIYEGNVIRVDFPNKGIIIIDGETAIVKNVMPGQFIKFAVNKVRSGKAEGKLLEVLHKSSLETRLGSCKNFGACGGCSYQTMSYENQIKMKKEQVKKIVDQVVNEDFIFEGILGSPFEWEYRNKMEFSFGDEYKEGPLALGLHKKGSFHDIVTVDDCKIVDKDYNKILSCVLKYCTDLGANYYHKLTHRGYLRHLLVRRAVKTGEILVNIITTTQEDWVDTSNIERMENSNQDLNNNKMDEESNLYNTQENLQSVSQFDKKDTDVFAPLVELLLSLNLNGTIVGVLHTYNDSKADVVKSDRLEILYGRDYIVEELLDLQFKISTFSFFQTNSLGAEVLYSKVREYVGETKDKQIFDLYSGTGTIAQLLAPVASKVTGVEIVEEAVEAAKQNAALNGLTNCEFIAGDVLKVIDSLEDKPDIIVLDPPRDGIHPKALDKIINFGVDRIVYISCKPTSLARDLEVLQEKGYQVENVCAVDMFPMTVHVECVVLLSQQKPNDRIEVDLDLDELDATSAEMKATYAKIKDYVLKA